MKHLDYTIWSSPVISQGLRAFSPHTLWNRIYTYNTLTDVWDREFDSDSDSDKHFEKGIGYMFRAPNNLVTPSPYTYNGIFEGVPTNGDVALNFANLGAYQSIGNPYPSNISAELFRDVNNQVSPTIGTLYFWTNTNPWDSELGDYTANNWASFSQLGATQAANDAIENTPNGVIPVGQGFVAEVTANPIVFNNAMRVSDSGIFFRTLQEEKHRLWLNLANESQDVNQILIGYMNQTTNDEDFGYDAELFGNPTSALYTLIENNSKNFVIQSRSLPFDYQYVVSLGLKVLQAGTYSISLHSFDGLFAEGQQIFMSLAEAY
jgi:hypothetical protein